MYIAMCDCQDAQSGELVVIEGQRISDADYTDICQSLRWIDVNPLDVLVAGSDDDFEYACGFPTPCEIALSHGLDCATCPY